MSVLRNLNLAYKFLLVLLIVSVPAMLFGTLYFGSQSSAIEFSSKEEQGVDYLIPVQDVLQQVSKYTALVTAESTSVLANQKSLYRQKANSQESAVNTAISRVDAIESSQEGALSLSGNWSSVKSDWASVKNSSQPDAGARLAAKIVGFMVTIGDASNLILDPDLDSFYVMDAVVIRLPELHHEIELNRNLMRKRAAGGGSSAVSTLDIKVSLDRVKAKLSAAKSSLDTVFSNNLEVQSALSGLLRTLDSEVSAYVNLVNGELKNQSINIQLISGQADTSESAWQSVSSAAAPELKKLLVNRISGLDTEMYSNLTIVLVSIVLSLIAAFYLYRSVTAPISEAIGVFARIQRGDLSSKIVVDSTCETGKLMKALSDMQEHLGAIDDISRMLDAMGSGDLKVRINSQYQGKFGELKDNANRLAETFVGIVGNIQETSSAVRVAAGEISEGNKNLSNRTENQAASLEQTAASMEEITSTIKQNTENARQADQLSAIARETAEEGGKVVSRAITAMSTINESSSKIADIISVIDEIAFQTNLLALNASVEAARAGEQGRGFAVVAGEVRNLAGRSATAAKEIKELIEDSVGKVEEGSELVNHSGETLKEIVESVTKVSNIVSEITAASEEQTLGIEEMNRAITQIDEVTQQNTALVEEVAAASESTGDEAADLERQMMFFDIGNGGGARTASAAPASNRRSPDRAFSQPTAAASAAPSSNVTPFKAAAGDDEIWEEF